MSDNKNPPFLQGADNLRMAANMADVPTGKCAAPSAPARGRIAIAAKAMEADAERTPAAHTCKQRLKLSFYFDGTGNNQNADLPTFEHSNVARMFRARKIDSPKDGIYSYYIAGLGTYFREIGDLGGSRGLAFGGRGEARLQWALSKLQERRSAPNVIGIDIALVGFSRGAALARAFANRIQKLCEGASTGNGWVLKGTNIGVEIYFMGLWDTVASTGLPKSLNNQSLLGLVAGAFRGSDDPPVQRMRERDVSVVAYGRPGADPSPSTIWSGAEGHADWAADIAIPPIVTKGVHMMAGHEIRNSFPADTVIHKGVRPASFESEESIYPGAHSNVGGGYRPGEGGRSPRRGQQLSLITLRVMYEKAFASGVPLGSLYDAVAVRPDIRLDFGMALPTDPEENHAAARDFAELQRLWNRYLDHCGRSEKTLGQWFLAHMKAYYGWRFWNIKKNRSERANGQPTDDERAVRPVEAQARQEQTVLDRKIAAQEQSAPVQQARSATAAARARLQQSQQRLVLAQQSSIGWMTPVTPEQTRQMLAERQQQEASLKGAIADAQGRLGAAENAQSLAEDPLHQLEAQKATLPSQGTLGRNWKQYDDRLYEDAKQLSDAKLFKPWLRPHYKALVEAWEDEFLHNKGLINGDVMKFFETYVHDSLADFAVDATLPSDPRVVYIGGDEIERFAMLERLRSSQTGLAA